MQQRFQGIDLMGGALRMGYLSGIVVNTVPARIHRAQDIDIQRIPDHDAFSIGGTCITLGKLENFPLRLDAVAFFGGDDVLEIGRKPAIVQLLLLCGLEAVGDDVQGIFFCAVRDDFLCICYQELLCRQDLQVGAAELIGDAGIADLEIQQGMPHPFPAQLFPFDKAFAEAGP